MPGSRGGPPKTHAPVHVGLIMDFHIDDAIQVVIPTRFVPGLVRIDCYIDLSGVGGRLNV